MIQDHWMIDSLRSNILYKDGYVKPLSFSLDKHCLQKAPLIGYLNGFNFEESLFLVSLYGTNLFHNISNTLK